MQYETLINLHRVEYLQTEEKLVFNSPSQFLMFNKYLKF